LSTRGREKIEDGGRVSGSSSSMIEFHTENARINNNQNRHQASDHQPVLSKRRFASIIHQPCHRMLPDHNAVGRQ